MNNSSSSGGCARHALYVLLHAIVCPIVCGVATWFLIEREAGESKGWAFVVLTTASFALSLFSGFSYSSFQRSGRKAAHLTFTLSGFAFLPLLLFYGWVLVAWSMTLFDP